MPYVIAPLRLRVEFPALSPTGWELSDRVGQAQNISHIPRHADRMAENTNGMDGDTIGTARNMVGMDGHTNGMARDFNGMAGDTNDKLRHISSIFFNIQVPLCAIMAHVAQF